MSNIKKSIDLSGVEKLTGKLDELRAAGAKVYSTGVAGDKLREAVPAFIRTDSEKVIEGQNNAYIVMGRDRPADRLSGYGGKGDTQAGSIDVVVGRGGAGVGSVNDENEQVWVDPDFEKDAARIYISWKTDVDENFNLPNGSNSAKAKSAIGIKADNVRIISRESVKIVAGVDKINSRGGSSKASYGVDIIANNDDSDLQPLVKGENLVLALKELREEVDEMNGIVEGLLRAMSQVLTALASHQHPSPGAPSPEMVAVTTPNLITLATDVYSSIISNKLNAARFKLVYLEPIGERYINSRWNKTN